MAFPRDETRLKYLLNFSLISYPLLPRKAITLYGNIIFRCLPRIIHLFSFQSRHGKACLLGCDHSYHARIQKVLSEGANFEHFFLVDEGRKDQNTTIKGQSSARQRNTILMAFRWRAGDGLTLNAGLVAL